MENELLSPSSPGFPDMPPIVQAAMQEVWRTALGMAAAATPCPGAPNNSTMSALSIPALAPAPELVGMYQTQLESQRTFNLDLLASMAKKDESLKHLRTEYSTKIDLLTASVKDKGRQITTLEKTVRNLEAENNAARQRAEVAAIEAATLRGQLEALQAELSKLRQQ